MAQMLLERSASVEPPAAPWSPLRLASPATGYLSVYYADDLARVPVRQITRPRDNKSDPNIETGTYGLFSTCERGMRSGIVEAGAQYIFFICRWGDHRVVSGYYRLAWKAPGTQHSATTKDFALAADAVHFVDPPIPIADLPEPLASVAGTRFRLSKRIDSASTAALVSLLGETPNALPDYLSEVDRLERFQSYYSGYRYVSWQRREPFSWDMAFQYLEPSPLSGAVSNQSATGSWRCNGCDQFVINEALLKQCPFCGSMGTLRPVTDPTNPIQEE